MGNWSLPSLTDLYTNFLAYLKARDDDAARLNDTRADAATNLPNYAKRWNDTTKTFQNWLSSAWSSIVLAVAGGGTGASTAAGARTNLGVMSTAEATAAFTGIIATAKHDSTSVTMTTANTFYDGPSVSLAKGTWFIVGTVSVRKPQTVTSMQINAKLWDGTTVESAAFAWDSYAASTGYEAISLSLSGIVVLGSTTTLKISVSSDAANTTLLGTGNAPKASHIRAIKVA
jgi:hypothetical protein